MSLSEHIEEIRKSLGINRVDMANIMGINSKTYTSRISGDGEEFTIKDIRTLDEHLERVGYKMTFVHRIASASMLKEINEYKMSIETDSDGSINFKIKKV